MPIEDEDANEEVGDEGVDDVDRLYNWNSLLNELVAMEVSDDFKRKFVIYACGCLLAPNKRGEIKTNLWSCLQSVRDITNKNWAKYLLVKLCKELEDVQVNHRKYVGGCLYFLMIFYLDRVSIPSHSVPRMNPRVHAWTDHIISDRTSLEIRTHKDYGYGKIESQLNECPTSSNGRHEIQFELFVKLANCGFGNVAGKLAEIYNKAVTYQNVAIDCQQRIVKICDVLCSSSIGVGLSEQKTHGQNELISKGDSSGLKEGEKDRVPSQASMREENWNCYENPLENAHVPESNERFEEREEIDVIEPSDTRTVDEFTAQSKRVTRASKKVVSPGLHDGPARRTRATKRNVLVPSGRFVISSRAPVTRMDGKIASLVWSKEANQEELLVDMFDYSLTRADLMSLSPKQWVSSKVIDMYARMLNAHAHIVAEKINRFIVEPNVLIEIDKMARFAEQTDDAIFKRMKTYFKCRGTSKIDLSKCQMSLYALAIIGLHIPLIWWKNAFKF